MVCPELPHIRLQRDSCLIHDGSRIPISIFFNLSPSSTDPQLLYCASEEEPNPSTGTPQRYPQPTFEVRVTGNRRNVRHHHGRKKKSRNRTDPAGLSRPP